MLTVELASSQKWNRIITEYNSRQIVIDGIKIHYMRNTGRILVDSRYALRLPKSVLHFGNTLPCYSSFLKKLDVPS